MYVKKLRCHNCHIAIIAVLLEKTAKRNNWDTPSNRLRRRRSDAFRASSLLGDVLHFLFFPFLSFSALRCPAQSSLFLRGLPVPLESWGEGEKEMRARGRELVKRARRFCGCDVTTEALQGCGGRGGVQCRPSEF